MMTAAESRKVAQDVLDKAVQSDLDEAHSRIKEARERGAFSVIVSYPQMRDEVANALIRYGYGLSPFSDRDGSINLTITW